MLCLISPRLYRGYDNSFVPGKLTAPEMYGLEYITYYMGLQSPTLPILPFPLLEVS